MKIELFEKKGKKRRYLSSRNEDTTYHDICYKISRDGFDDVFVILRENNYCGDFDFYTKFESEDPGMKKRNFKPDLTSKDYENCVKILKSWRDVKDIFLPGANCSTRGHCEFSNINFLNLEIDYNFPELYRFYKVPVEKYLEEEFDLVGDENVLSLLSYKKVTFDKVSKKLFVEVSGKISDDQVRLILFVDNWLNLQEKKVLKKKFSEEIHELESRIKKASDALGEYENFEQMKLDLQQLKGGVK